MSSELTIAESSDNEAVVRAIVADEKPDPEVVRRVRARAQKITDEVFQKHGPLDIAVPAIREARDA